MIDLREAENIHNLLIEKFGGAKGIRDHGLLESSLKRPYQTFGGQELYPTPIDKAAAIFESLIANHPFLDGNKRIAYVLMRLMLKVHKLDIECTQTEKFEFVMKAARGELKNLTKSKPGSLKKSK